MLNYLKHIGISVLIIGAISFGYFQFFGLARGQEAPVNNSSFAEVNTGTDGEVVGADISALLVQINALKIDSVLFEDQSFKSLEDYTVLIPSQALGRENPFSPIGGKSGVSIQKGDISTTTLKTKTTTLKK